ncbi:hypothetical protein [Shewanella fidelis]|uniref:Uncharacterized protein n=1 Tax=Shewanella fidelis TaxID=173509 RepID=A0ABU4HCN9_9GAMM|nr:hypothetical protein [Shewanella fidelis]MDW4816303.1 hypothetical protein [Shewanella fidelis]MDW4825019.1 hypothetical protein [Shewanella fidelis]
MDVFVEHTWMYLQRASEVSAHTPAAGNWNHLSDYQCNVSGC